MMKKRQLYDFSELYEKNMTNQMVVYSHKDNQIYLISRQGFCFLKKNYVWASNNGFNWPNSLLNIEDIFILGEL